MTYEQAIEYFGSPRDLAEAAGVETRTVYQWRYRGGIPEKPQLKLQIVTAGRLRADGRRT